MKEKKGYNYLRHNRRERQQGSVTSRSTASSAEIFLTTPHGFVFNRSNFSRPVLHENDEFLKFQRFSRLLHSEGSVIT